MRLRFRYRAMVFCTIVALLCAGRYNPEVAAWPMAASPFVGFAALVGSIVRKTLFETAPYLVPALLMAIPCLLRRRFLCHTACPMGFCFDSLGKAKKAMTDSNRLPWIFRYFPRFGVPLAIFTWLGCFLGVAGFLWLDPFVLFGSPFHHYLVSGVKYGPLTYWSPLVYVLLVLAGAAWFWPTFWCRHFCPLGGTQDLLYSPKSVVEMLRSTKHVGGKPTARRMRRRFLVYGVVLLFLGYLFHYFRRYTNHYALWQRLQRPPGAVDETEFLALCTRCGACIQTCPTGYLVRGGGRLGMLDVGCPEVTALEK